MFGFGKIVPTIGVIPAVAQRSAGTQGHKPSPLGPGSARLRRFGRDDADKGVPTNRNRLLARKDSLGKTICGRIQGSREAP